MTPCDHTSVGILVYRGQSLLLIERKKYPYGFAPPSGHVDQRTTFEKAAESELYEEVGLIPTSLQLVAQGRRDNPCRRPGGTWHFWRIYRAETQGQPHPNAMEVKNLVWSDHRKLETLALRAHHFRCGLISDTEWSDQPGLELVWLDWFEELGILDRKRLSTRLSRWR